MWRCWSSGGRGQERFPAGGYGGTSKTCWGTCLAYIVFSSKLSYERPSSNGCTSSGYKDYQADKQIRSCCLDRQCQFSCSIPNSAWSFLAVLVQQPFWQGAVSKDPECLFLLHCTPTAMLQNSHMHIVTVANPYTWRQKAPYHQGSLPCPCHICECMLLLSASLLQDVHMYKVTHIWGGLQLRPCQPGPRAHCSQVLSRTSAS